MAWFGRKSSAPSIDSLKFETDGWKFHGEKEPGQMRLWETPDSDAVLLHFFGVPPNLPVTNTVDDISAMYASGLAAGGGKVVECTVGKFAHCDAVRLLLKAPQKPSGMMYQAAVTIPFRDFSFVVKIQSPEHGSTGVREAVLAEKRMAAGEMPDVSGKGPFFRDWNPDAPEYDEQFPTHPVSRVRRILAHVARTASLDQAVASLPKFPLPGGTP
jgi:hypothetical protein